jgi:hypothetical protein
MRTRFPLAWRSLQVLFALGTITLLTLSSSAGDDKAILERMRQDLKFLASEECQGRGTETAGINKAADYIVKQFQQAGLKPGGKDSYFQPFSYQGRGQLQSGSQLVLHGPQGQTIKLDIDTHFQVMGVSAGGQVTAPLVFGGYGITAPNLKFDEYKDLDVAGKVVLLIRKTPWWDHPHLKFDGDNQRQHATFDNKIANAELHKAAAVLIVNDRGELEDGDKLLPFKDLVNAPSSSIPALQVKRSVVDPIIRSSLGSSLEEIEKAIDRDLTPRGTPLTGWQATVETKVERKETFVKNVIGVLPGSGPLAKEYVIIGAHYDHLGFGETGSLAKNSNERNLIHFGADDNASGTTAILELARRFGAMKDRQGRTLVFMAFSAEEKGLLGSRHYCNKEPLFPLKSTAAMVNLDMVGRMQADTKTNKGKLRVQGVGTGKGFEALIETLNKEFDFDLIKTNGGTGPSDHDSFFRKDIPVFFFWTGVHSDYHRPTDTWDRINYKDMARITNLTENVIDHLRTEEKRPEFVKVASPVTGGVSPGNLPKLGIMPGYEEGKKGLIVEGVGDDGPAAKAGIKTGDLIIEIGGLPITNIGTYMAAMGQQKRGTPTPITVLRDAKKLTLKVTPQ